MSFVSPIQVGIWGLGGGRGGFTAALKHCYLFIVLYLSNGSQSFAL